MSTTTSECLSGCALRDRHLTDCEDEGCRGCLPRPAEFGNLCAWCFQRLTGDVVDSPGLVHHLRELAEPHAGTKPTGDGRGSADPAFGSILSGAVDAADEVHATLASWAHLVLEEHPNGPQMQGPDESGTVRTSTVAVLDGDIAHEHGPYLRKSTVAGIRDPHATERLVRWMLPMLTWCSEQEWAGEMRHEMSSVVRTTMARWPMEDTRTRAISGVECVACSHMSLTYTPTSGFKLPFHVACTHPDCGRMYTEDEYDGVIGRLTIERGHVA